MIEHPRSVVRALVADFVDHSRADRCRCGSAQAPSLSQEPAQAGAGGAAPVTKPVEGVNR
ncbi:DUF7324 family protein [Gordonia westfalica]|uniref:DUF7324 family protein n=1 Tax=Gordonia westfalica TaxID=158898 RepID=UPI003CC7ABAB